MSDQQRDCHDGEFLTTEGWGFRVYRLTYKDQALWEDYLEYIEVAIRATIDWRVDEDLWISPDLPPEQQREETELREEAEATKRSFHLCLKEGPELDGCSVEDIREINSNWLLGLKPSTRDMLPFDIRTSNTTDSNAKFSPSYNDDVPVKMMWTGYGIFEGSGWDTDEYEEDEDNFKVWQCLHAYRLPSFYFAVVTGDFSWFDYFVKPPRLNRFNADHID
ncbi:hypothetical protein B0T11DRAFT_295730 [Plectosphaerella cucumerina]|uniref:Uncharacterized protein n=1 Tax=Plectosphaerella cucumerina TaxID=40658 RepID=A0A8K0TIZ3_9PEZI|nr:hypothetical protein B0T11DRAFT_295730 [Plectosphaerella cucumerina]